MEVKKRKWLILAGETGSFMKGMALQLGLNDDQTFNKRRRPWEGHS